MTWSITMADMGRDGFEEGLTTALAVCKPRSHQELLEIYGIGTVKAERFGKIVLLVIVCSALDYFNDSIVPNFFHITPR